MNCTDIRDQFSARFDGELEGQALEAFETHWAECPYCATAWWDFLRSTQALREVGVAPVSADYVDSIVGAVLADELGEGPTLVPFRPAGRRSMVVVSHLGAVLLGAALVLLLLWLGGALARPPGAQVEPLVEPGAEESELLVQETTESEPGPVADPEAVELVLPPSEPRIEIVERVVERIEYVPIPVPSDAPEGGLLLASAFNYLGDSLANLSVATEAYTARLHELREPPSSDPGAEPRDEPRLEDLVPRRRRPVTSLAYRDDEDPLGRDATLVVTRQGEQLSLETRGSLDEVVPALIARLDDADPKIAELVQLRLQEIWSERTGADANAAPYGVARLEERNKRFGWRRWVNEEAEEQEPRSPVEEWTSWWSQEQTLVASAGI